MNFRRIAVGLNVAPLLDALAVYPEHWNALTFRQTFPGSAHHDTQSIYLTYCERIDVESVFNDLRAVSYPALADLPEAADLINDALHLVGARSAGRVMLVDLKAGGRITPHIDEGAYADHYERFHLVITSEAGNVFECGGDTAHMKPGELWWFNHKRLHSVSNYSDTPRLHLIVDAVAPKYRVERDAKVAA
jgi:aspartyl/asparaginyl beta-hydroxylase (cupin superfamily)